MRTSFLGRSPTARGTSGRSRRRCRRRRSAAKEVADLNGTGCPTSRRSATTDRCASTSSRTAGGPRGAVHIPGHGVAGRRRRDLDGRPHGGRRRRHRRCRCRRHLGRRVDLPAAHRWSAACRRRSLRTCRPTRWRTTRRSRSRARSTTRVADACGTTACRSSARGPAAERSISARRRSPRTDRSASRTSPRPPAPTTTRWSSRATRRTRARRARRCRSASRRSRRRCPCRSRAPPCGSGRRRR